MGKGIILNFGGTQVLATLNDSETARAFYEALPLKVRVSNSSGLDYCGVMPIELPWEDGQVHHGWKNGAVNYNPHGGWLAILFGGEEVSAGYGDQVDMGVVEGDLSVFDGLDVSYELLIEQA